VTPLAIVYLVLAPLVVVYAVASDMSEPPVWWAVAVMVTFAVGTALAVVALA
jgi:hypothetical protein